MGRVSQQKEKDEAMELALLLYDIYTEAQESSEGTNGQNDANADDD